MPPFSRLCGLGVGRGGVHLAAHILNGSGQLLDGGRLLRGALGQGLRTLASKSAEASKNTAVLIEDTVAAVKEGIDLSQETSQALQASEQTLIC